MGETALNNQENKKLNNNDEDDKIFKIINSKPVKVLGFIVLVSGIITIILRIFGIEYLYTNIIGAILIIAYIIYLTYSNNINKTFYKKQVDMLQEKEENLIKDKENCEKLNKQTITNLESANENLKKDNKEVKSKIDKIEKSIHKGFKYLSNTVSIYFNDKEKLYEFQFEKTMRIISDIIPQVYESQFYVNKFISDKNEAIKYYKENHIIWGDLGFGARVQIKRNSTNYSRATKVKVLNITDDNNYIPFKIYFENLDNNSKIDLKKDDEIILTYKYKVPIKLWGSYINRHASYFAEPIKVELKYDDDKNLEIKSINKIAASNEPLELNSEEYEYEESEQPSMKIKIFKFTPNQYERYRILWDSKSYFGGDEITTIESKDELGITDK